MLPTRADQILAQRSGETTILLNPDNGEYYTLDEVGGRIWELCDGNRRVADVVATLQSEYDAPPATIESDVTELLDELTREQLLKTSAAT